MATITLALQVAADHRERLTIFGTDYPTEDGTCVRDYIYVLDLARAPLLALDAAEPGTHEIYNLGNRIDRDRRAGHRQPIAD